jgi:L-threonylcarbamoyladenylate synthase
VTYEIDPANPDRVALQEAAGVLAVGGLVVLPTETVYGIAARPDVPGATDRLFEAKQRPSSLNLPILAAAASQAWTVAEPTTGAGALAAAFWPGPLTLVLRRTRVSAGWALGDRADTVGIRVPDHHLAHELLEATGPLAATSANISGQSPASTRDELVATFLDKADVILVLAEGAPPPGGTASTVVDATGDRVHILRAGAIDERAILTALAEGGPGRGR